MRITENRLRRIIRSVILESMGVREGEIDVDELCLDAIEHFYIDPSTHLNHRGDGQYNAWIMHWCYDNGLRDVSKMKNIIEKVKEVLKDLDSVSVYLMGNQTQRGMAMAQTFSKISHDLARGM